MRDYALIYLNGKRREIRGAEAFMMLADWLRKEVGLTGTKIVCAEGDCGACTVLRAFPKPDQLDHPPQFEAMNSCITLVAQMDGSHLVTVEGLARDGVPSPVQKAMQECHGSQCGYCTPGFVVALSAAFERHAQIDGKTAANYLTGNLCRCTGYSPILAAAAQVQPSADHSVARRYLSAESVADLRAHQRDPLHLTDRGRHFWGPVTLRDASKIFARGPGARILGASTDVGVRTNKGAPLSPSLLSLHLIPELYAIKVSRKAITVGARVTLAELRRACSTVAPEFARFLDIFASPQIKNSATLVGNIANASPIGDTLPFLLIAGGQVHVVGGGKKRVIPMTELYVGYKKLSLSADEWITHVSFNVTGPEEKLALYKVSQRKDLDISAVSSAFSLEVGRRDRVVKRARLAYGGVAATPLRMAAAERLLEGQKLTQSKIQEVADAIQSAIKPLDDVRGSAAYRKVLAGNLFKRYCLESFGGSDA